MNALICIGCDSYEHLSPLGGAEKDAQDVHDVLSRQEGLYNAAACQCLLSPSTGEIRAALNTIFQANEELDLFTFFFAGHATVKAGSFYLCLRESEADRLSTTAYPIIELFSVLNEFHPQQVNIVVDACEAGGASFDLAQLLKPEVIGRSEASSITFLGACSPNEAADETDGGGVLTRQLLRCLNGEREIQTRTPHLDLIEIGSSVCQEMRSSSANQKPVAWGLSLFGNGRFADNPHFVLKGEERAFPTGTVLPRSDMGRRIRANSTALWEEYRAIELNPSPRRLLTVLNSTFGEPLSDVTDVATSLEGLARTMCARARESSELMAASQCLATCAVSLLPQIDSGPAKRFTRWALKEMMAMDTATWDELAAGIKSDSRRLIGNGGGVADLYYLPLRVTRLFGWVGLSVLTGSLLPELNDGRNPQRIALALSLAQSYTNSLVTVSDEQAAPLYVFLTACLVAKERNLAETVLNHYYASFVARKANVAAAGASGVQAFRYISSLGPPDFRPEEWHPANPSHLLPVLLSFAAKLNLGSDWDLQALDRVNSCYFIPVDYREFGREVIDEGTNHTHQIGFGVWSVRDFQDEFERTIKAEMGTSASAGMPIEGVALSTIASLLFPNRLPLLLESQLMKGLNLS